MFESRALLFLLGETQNLPCAETNRKRVAALRTEGKYSSKHSVKRAPRALFPRPDWMKGDQPSWASFLSPSISQQRTNPIFQQEFDVWTLGIPRHRARYCCQDTFLASSGFRKCSRNGKPSVGIISSGSNGTQADKVGGFGFRGLVYMNLFSGSAHETPGPCGASGSRISRRFGSKSCGCSCAPSSRRWAVRITPHRPRWCPPKRWGLPTHAAMVSLEDTVTPKVI